MRSLPLLSSPDGDGLLPAKPTWTLWHSCSTIRWDRLSLGPQRKTRATNARRTCRILQSAQMYFPNCQGKCSSPRCCTICHGILRRTLAQSHSHNRQRKSLTHRQPSLGGILLSVVVLILALLLACFHGFLMRCQ